MKNRLADLNDYLFDAIGRIGQAELKGEQPAEELNRAKEISSLAGQIISNGNLVLKAHLASVEWESMSKKKLPPMLEG